MPLSGCLVMTYSKRRKRKGCKRKITDQEEIEPAVKVRKQVCVFCQSSEVNELDYGELITHRDITVHYFCLLLSSGLGQNGKLSDKNTIRGFLKTDILKEQKRGGRLRCYFCQEKGATIGCCMSACKKVFHLPCGRKNRTFHLFFDKFSSYCEQHWLLHRNTAFENSSLCSTKKSTCAICLSSIDARSSCDSLSSSCCTKSWFHRVCIQRYAMSAGKHFFKCPLCNCLADFQQEMLDSGIYIPDQDASWERQPNAFSELLERHSTCDAPECKCPQGRSHDDEKGSFELILCQTCGSFGSHKACGGLVQDGTSSLCQLCHEIDSIQATSKLHVESNKSTGSSSMHLNCEGHGTHSQTSPSAVSASTLMDNLHEKKKDSYKDDFDNESLLKSVSMPSVVVVRIDSLFPIPCGTVNLKKVLKWKYDQNSRCFVRRRPYIKSGLYSKNHKVEKKSAKRLKQRGAGCFVKRPYVKSGMYSKYKVEIKPAKSRDEKAAGCHGKRPYVKSGLYGKKHKQKVKAVKKFNQQYKGVFVKKSHVKSGMDSKKSKGEVKPAKSHNEKDAGCCGKRPYVNSGFCGEKHKQEMKATKRFNQQDIGAFFKMSFVKGGTYVKKDKIEVKPAKSSDENDAGRCGKRPYVKSGLYGKKHKQEMKAAKNLNQQNAKCFVKKSDVKSEMYSKKHIVDDKPVDGFDQQGAGCSRKRPYVKSGMYIKKHKGEGKPAEISVKRCKNELDDSEKLSWQGRAANKRDMPVKRKPKVSEPEITKEKRKKAVKEQTDRSSSTQLTLDKIWKTVFTKSTNTHDLEEATLICKRFASEKEELEKKKEELDQIKKAIMKRDVLSGTRPKKKILAVQRIANKKKSIALKRIAVKKNIVGIEHFVSYPYLKMSSASQSVVRKQFIAKKKARMEIGGSNGTRSFDENLIHLHALNIARGKTARKEVIIWECQQSSETILEIHPGSLSASNDQENQDIGNISIPDLTLTPFSHDNSNPLSSLDSNCGTQKANIVASSIGKRTDSEIGIDVKKDESNLQFGISNFLSDLDIKCVTKKGSHMSSSLEKKIVDPETKTETAKDVISSKISISNSISDLDITYERIEGSNMSSSVKKESVDTKTNMEVEKGVSNSQIGISNLEIVYEPKDGSYRKEISDDMEMEIKKDVSNLQLGISGPPSDLITCETNEGSVISSSIEKKNVDSESDMEVKKDVSGLQLGISGPPPDLITCETKEESIISNSIEKKNVDSELDMEVKKHVSCLQFSISGPPSD